METIYMSSSFIAEMGSESRKSIPMHYFLKQGVCVCVLVYNDDSLGELLWELLCKIISTNGWNEKRRCYLGYKVPFYLGGKSNLNLIQALFFGKSSVFSLSVSALFSELLTISTDSP